MNWFDIRCYFDGIDPWCFGDSLKGFDLSTLIWLYLGGIAIIAILNLGIGGSHDQEKRD